MDQDANDDLMCCHKGQRRSAAADAKWNSGNDDSLISSYRRSVQCFRVRTGNTQSQFNFCLYTIDLHKNRLLYDHLYQFV